MTLYVVSELAEPDFDAWYSAARVRVLATAVLTLGEMELATDATDEAFVRAFSNWERVRRMGSPVGWTVRVALNVGRRRASRTALERRVLRRRRPSLHFDPDMPAVGEAWAAVTNLPQRQRQVLVLRYAADLAEQDIADALSISRSSVSSALTAGRRSLAAHLKEERPESDPFADTVESENAEPLHRPAPTEPSVTSGGSS